MRSEWKTDLGEIKADLHAREARLVKWIAGLVVAGGGRRGWRRDSPSTRFSALPSAADQSPRRTRRERMR